MKVGILGWKGHNCDKKQLLKVNNEEEEKFYDNFHDAVKQSGQWETAAIVGEILLLNRGNNWKNICIFWSSKMQWHRIQISWMRTVVIQQHEQHKVYHKHPV